MIGRSVSKTTFMKILVQVAPELFLGASYAIALSSATDRHHQRAVELSSQVEADNSDLVTTRAVILEIGNALSRLRYRAAAVALLDAVENDPAVEVVALSEDLYSRGLELYRRHQDKEWGLTDCISFTVMRERSITDALTADDHFRQAGFRVLLTQS